MIEALLPLAAKGVGPLVSYFRSSLQGDEKELVEASFHTAIVERGKDMRRPPAPDNAKKLKRVVREVWDNTKDVGKLPTLESKVRRRRERELANGMARAWAEAPTPGGAPRVEGGFSLPGSWQEALDYFIAQAAFAAAADPLAVDVGEKGKKERDDLREAWRYLLNNGDKAPSQAEAKELGVEIGERVRRIWRETERLEPLLDQLNHDSAHATTRAIAVSTQEIAERLRRLATVTIPATVAGGGGVALLVLYLDKG